MDTLTTISRFEIEKYRTMFDNSNDFLFTLDLKGTFTDVNRAAEMNTGYTRQELIGMSFREYTHKINHPQLVAAFSKVFKTGEPVRNYALEAYIKDNQKRYFEVNLSLLKIEGKPVGFFGSARDITTEKQALEDLHDSEEKFRAIGVSANDAIILIDNDGFITFWNDASENIFQYSREEVLGKELHSFLAPEQFRPEYKKHFTRFRKTGEGNAVGKTLEISALRKDGEEVQIALSLSAVKLKGKWTAIGIIRDITQQKWFQRRLHEQTEELKLQNEELDAYAHSVAHDLKNPLGVVMGYTDLILMEEDRVDPAEFMEYVREINQTGKSMQRIIENLLLLASLRKQEISPIPFNMGDVFEEARLRVKHMCPKTQCRLPVPEKWPTVLGYPAWVEEVWVNYLTNAIKYGGDPTGITIGYQRQETEGPLPDHFRFWVKDQGPGIRHEHLGKLFKTFERLEAVDTKGHGLGLSIVKRIIEKLDGTVGVISEPGQGSTFYFTLPAAE